MMTDQDPLNIDSLRTSLGPSPKDWNGQVKHHVRRRMMADKYSTKMPSANKYRKDGTALFKLVGGSYHDIEIRSQFPFDPVTFPNGETYVYSDEPMGARSKRHVYILEKE